MGKYQVGIELSNKEVMAISSFLKTLTGHYEETNLN